MEKEMEVYLVLAYGPIWNGIDWLSAENNDLTTYSVMIPNDLAIQRRDSIWTVFDLISCAHSHSIFEFSGPKKTHFSWRIFSINSITKDNSSFCIWFIKLLSFVIVFGGKFFNLHNTFGIFSFIHLSWFYFPLLLWWSVFVCVREFFFLARGFVSHQKKSSTDKISEFGV